MTAGIVIAFVSLAAWIYLLTARGGFWRADIRDDRNTPPSPEEWPSITAVMPARNEVDVIGKSISSLLAQDYPQPLRVVLIDDQSDDGTSTAARLAAGDEGDRLTILSGKALPPGWTGKLWAVKQGIEQARSAGKSAALSPSHRCRYCL